ncbi:MAG: helix-turn-helix domain-containing protein [Gemmatimonadota bacterium]
MIMIMIMFSPPTQKRSRRTYEALLEAARETLAETSFDDATLAEISRRAGVTVGAFYGRFGGKDALLRHLEEQTYEAAERLVQATALATRSAGLREAAAGYIDMLVEMYTRQRGVVRALVEVSRDDPEVRARRKAFNARLLGRVVSDLLRRREDIAHPRPEEALRLGLLFVSATLRELLLFGEYWPKGAEPDAPAAELTEAFLAYLRVPDPVNAEVDR